MLLLSRKRNERIIINGNIVITVTEIHGEKVRLGFEAPDSVSIDREEVYLQKAAYLDRLGHTD